MRQTLEEYCRDVNANAERFAREEVICQRIDHLRAFNFGRMMQRVENSRREARQRVRCLLLGLVMGVACGRAHPDNLYHALAHKFLAQANFIVREAESSALWRLWKVPRLRV